VLDRWYSWAIRSRREPIKKVARTAERHRDGILRWFDSKIPNGLIEATNSLVQAAKAKAGLSLTAQSHRHHRLDRPQNRPQVGYLRQRIPCISVPMWAEALEQPRPDEA